ncbi:hypothetical protein EJ110_NYTH53601, partial [Nymphaea thermarum]
VYVSSPQNYPTSSLSRSLSLPLFLLPSLAPFFFPSQFLPLFTSSPLIRHSPGVLPFIHRLAGTFMMGSQSGNEPSEFMKKMKKTVFVDNVSGLVTDSMIRKAFEQFGTVVNISFIPDYLEQNNASKCVLVEMESEKKATSLLVETSNLPFMLGGMPRPIRCRMAEPEMFSERPRKSDRKMTCRWIQPNDPDFEVAKRMKELVKKHEAEAFALRKARNIIILERHFFLYPMNNEQSCLLDAHCSCRKLCAQLEEEVMLAKKQEETLKSNFKKLQMIDGVVDDGTIYRLADRYGIQITED